MATLTRSKSSNPTYKDYVNFLGNYKSGTLKRDDQSSDSGVSSVRSFPLSNSSNSTSSSSVNSDVTDFSKTSACVSYNNFLESAKSKKFHPVKPNKINENATKKSEIFIEIQPAKSVSEVSKIFEQKPENKATASHKIVRKINLFERQQSAEIKPKIAEKPVIIINKPDKMSESVPDFPPPPPEFCSEVNTLNLESRDNEDLPPPPPEFLNNTPPPPPPPMMPVNFVVQKPKLQATLKNGPQTSFSVKNPNRANLGTIDRNDPMVRKLVYGTLRGLYGAYHDKANDIVGTLPRNMVKQSNGVQKIIDEIASNGDLEKLNGRVNPKLEQERA